MKRKLEFIDSIPPKHIVEFTGSAPKQLKHKMIAMKPSNVKSAIRFDNKIDVRSATTVAVTDPEYTGSNLPTVKDLINKGFAKEWTINKYITIQDVLSYDEFQTDGVFDVVKLHFYLQELGAPVTIFRLKNRLKEHMSKNADGVWNLKIVSMSGMMRPNKKQTIVENF